MNMTTSPVDPDGLMEFSVVFTDRSLNHMSKTFQRVMTDLNAMLCEVYQAETAIIVPGGGTFGMEAVARQFATDQKVMVIRNGWFSYRWTQIFDMGDIPSETAVIKATQVGNESTSAFAPQPIEVVAAKIRDERPNVVFAPHVETSSGVILPDDYLKAIAEAAHDVGALFVLDCIASGSIWVDMKTTGVDVLISAPQKGWSASPSAGLVMLSARAIERLNETKSSSFAVDLRKWHDIMQAYVGGSHAYHSTMPTDALLVLRDRMIETRDFGFDLARDRQWELGTKVRALLSRNGFKPVAAPGFEAPGVVVSYTKDPEFQNGKKFVAQGMQIASGVPLMCDEPADFRTFRIGLFGLDKLGDVDGTVARLETVLDTLAAG
ncbi:serine-pyruvate aminotransferase/archaeal aspartate aminotransferase [Hoeflea sp. IMCC20628]|uniref:aminotransferase class V-fold PLP-dependent enzyme n=1 Tax=Hoeflea sp. IMCC20628 TaxID=1620421 RepID=UPI00063AE9E2|nr:aminotransferase class V-fold PLP-dependent enzyme [Hoeflea sp. IMCC20628]AKI02023.1 serine-pyruvate aminotransferase/archaeal aspartate aminotransferase [Hoeflea sp. IMCC20628]